MSAIVPSNVIGAMLISSVRYALGRRTYIVGETCGWVRRYWPEVADRERAIIFRDVSEATTKGDLGGECDRVEWRALRAWLEEHR